MTVPYRVGSFVEDLIDLKETHMSFPSGGGFGNSPSEHVLYSTQLGVTSESKTQSFLRSKGHADGNISPMEGFTYNGNTSMHDEQSYFPPDRQTFIQQEGLYFGLISFYLF